MTPRLVRLAADSPAALQARAAEVGDAGLAALPEAADTGPYRLALVVDGEAPRALADQLAGAAAHATRHRPRWRPARLAFVIPGQGGQAPRMLADLAQRDPVIQAALARCAEAVPAFPLREVLAASDARVHDVENAQPALVAVAVAVAERYRAWGVEADVVFGHSLGELVAGWYAGALSLATLMQLAVARGALMAALDERGGMWSVFAPLGVVEAALVEGAEVAAVNGPEHVVISGADAACAEAVRGLAHRRLPIAQASHCALLEPMLDAWERTAAAHDYRAPSRRWIGGVDGRPITQPPTASWFRQTLRAPVRFDLAARALAADFVEAYVELGPRPTLASLGPEATPHGDWWASLDGAHPDARSLRDVAAELYRRGVG